MLALKFIQNWQKTTQEILACVNVGKTEYSWLLRGLVGGAMIGWKVGVPVFHDLIC